MKSRARDAAHTYQRAIATADRRYQRQNTAARTDLEHCRAARQRGIDGQAAWDAYKARGRGR